MLNTEQDWNYGITITTKSDNILTYVGSLFETIEGVKTRWCAWDEIEPYGDKFDGHIFVSGEHEVVASLAMDGDVSEQVAKEFAETMFKALSNDDTKVVLEYYGKGDDILLELKN